MSELDHLIQEALRGRASAVGSRAGRRRHVEDRLAALKSRFHRTGMFDLSADEIDTLAVQQVQWEATAYAAAGDILQRAHAEAASRAAARQPGRFLQRARIVRSPDGTGDGAAGAVDLDDLRILLWPVVQPWIDDAGPDDLGWAFALADRAFRWAARNAATMPGRERTEDIQQWLEAGVLADLESEPGAAAEAEPGQLEREVDHLVRALSSALR